MKHKKLRIFKLGAVAMVLSTLASFTVSNSVMANKPLNIGYTTADEGLSEVQKMDKLKTKIETSAIEFAKIQENNESSGRIAGIDLSDPRDDYRSLVFSPTYLNSKIGDSYDYENCLFELEDENGNIYRSLDKSSISFWHNGSDLIYFRFGTCIADDVDYKCVAQEGFNYKSDSLKARIYKVENEVINKIKNKEDLWDLELGNPLFVFEDLGIISGKLVSEVSTKVVHPDQYDRNYYINYMSEKYPELYADYREDGKTLKEDKSFKVSNNGYSVANIGAKSVENSSLEERKNNLHDRIESDRLTYERDFCNTSDNDLATIFLNKKSNQNEYNFVFSPTKIKSEIKANTNEDFYDFEDCLLELEDENGKIYRSFDKETTFAYYSSRDVIAIDIGPNIASLKDYLAVAEEGFNYKSSNFKAKLFKPVDKIGTKEDLLKADLEKDLVFDFETVKLDPEQRSVEEAASLIAHPEEYDKDYYIHHLAGYSDKYADYRQNDKVIEGEASNVGYSAVKKGAKPVEEVKGGNSLKVSNVGYVTLGEGEKLSEAQKKRNLRNKIEKSAKDYVELHRNDKNSRVAVVLSESADEFRSIVFSPTYLNSKLGGSYDYRNCLLEVEDENGNIYRSLDEKFVTTFTGSFDVVEFPISKDLVNDSAYICFAQEGFNFKSDSLKARIYKIENEVKNKIKNKEDLLNLELDEPLFDFGNVEIVSRERMKKVSTMVAHPAEFDRDYYIADLLKYDPTTYADYRQDGEGNEEAENLNIKKDNLSRAIRESIVDYDKHYKNSNAEDLVLIYKDNLGRDKTEGSLLFSPTQVVSQIKDKLENGFYNFDDCILELEDENGNIYRNADKGLSLTWKFSFDLIEIMFSKNMADENGYLCTTNKDFNFNSESFKARIYKSNVEFNSKEDLANAELDDLVFDFGDVKVKHFDERLPILSKSELIKHPEKFDENYHINYAIEKDPDNYADYRNDVKIDEDNENNDDNEGIDNNEDNDDNEGIDNNEDNDDNENVDTNKDNDDNENVDTNEDNDDNEDVDNNEDNDDNENVDTNKDNDDNENIDTNKDNDDNENIDTNKDNDDNENIDTNKDNDDNENVDTNKDNDDNEDMGNNKDNDDNINININNNENNKNEKSDVVLFFKDNNVHYDKDTGASYKYKRFEVCFSPIFMIQKLLNEGKINSSDEFFDNFCCKIIDEKGNEFYVGSSVNNTLLSGFKIYKEKDVARMFDMLELDQRDKYIVRKNSRYDSEFELKAGGNYTVELYKNGSFDQNNLVYRTKVKANEISEWDDMDDQYKMVERPIVENYEVLKDGYYKKADAYMIELYKGLARGEYKNIGTHQFDLIDRLKKI